MSLFLQTKTHYPLNISVIYFPILVLAFALMKSNLLPFRSELALPILATRGPRAMACEAGVCPARPAAVEGSRPPSGCYPRSSRTSVVCTSSPSRSPRSESQRRLSPGRKIIIKKKKHKLRENTSIRNNCSANVLNHAETEQS